MLLKCTECHHEFETPKSGITRACSNCDAQAPHLLLEAETALELMIKELVSGGKAEVPERLRGTEPREDTGNFEPPDRGSSAVRAAGETAEEPDDDGGEHEVCPDGAGSEHRRLIRNAVHCNVCNTTIDSKHRHDFVDCGCPVKSTTTVFVDGGLEYVRFGWGEDADFTQLYQYSDGYCVHKEWLPPVSRPGCEICERIQKGEFD